MGRPASPSPSRIVALSPDDGTAIDLKNPALAAALSWLVPGLGQLYQGRSFKGAILMGALLATIAAGLALSDGKAVYYEWRRGPTRQTRWAFLGQLGVGGLAIPAYLQTSLLDGSGRQPLLGLSWFAPPLTSGQEVSEAYARRLADTDPDIDIEDFRRQGGVFRFEPGQAGGQVSMWQKRLGRSFDIGTLYTLLAGLLNILVVYDAWAGPVQRADEETDGEGPEKPGVRRRP